MDFHSCSLAYLQAFLLRSHLHQKAFLPEISLNRARTHDRAQLLPFFLSLKEINKFLKQFILAKSMSSVTYLIVAFQMLANNFIHSYFFLFVSPGAGVKLSIYLSNKIFKLLFLSISLLGLDLSF